MTLSRDLAVDLYDILSQSSDFEARDKLVTERLIEADAELTQVIFCFTIGLWPIVCEDSSSCGLIHLPTFITNHKKEILTHFQDRSDLSEAFIPLLFPTDSVKWAQSATNLMAFVIAQAENEEVVSFLLNIFTANLVKQFVP